MKYIKNISILSYTVLLSFGLSAEISSVDNKEQLPNALPHEKSTLLMVLRTYMEKKIEHSSFNLPTKNGLKLGIDYAQTPEHFDNIENTLKVLSCSEDDTQEALHSESLYHLADVD